MPTQRFPFPFPNRVEAKFYWNSQKFLKNKYLAKSTKSTIFLPKMPGKSKKLLKNRPIEQSFAQSLTTANKATNDNYSRSASTCSSSNTNPIRSSSLLINSDKRKNHDNTNIKFILTKTTDGQASKTPILATSHINKTSLSQHALTKTAIDLDMDAKKSNKGKREAETAA